MADDDKNSGPMGQAKDLAQLLQDYAKQETLGPLKGVGRYILWGVAGSITLCIGLFLLLLAGLRALQTETGTALTGNWSWAPYFMMTVVAAAVIGLAVRGILKEPKAGDA